MFNILINMSENEHKICMISSANLTESSAFFFGGGGAFQYIFFWKSLYYNVANKYWFDSCLNYILTWISLFLYRIHT